MMNLFSRYKKLNVDNHSIFLRKHSIDFEVYDYVFNEKYHRPSKELTSKTPTILDLGTNIGLTVVDFKIKYPGSIIYGYEMDKDNYELALKNTKSLSGVSLFNSAVWFEVGHFTYNKNGNFDAYKLGGESSAADHKITVPTISIGKIISDNDLKVIDFVKMDIEGAELEIFEKDLDWLNITSQIKIEVHYGEKEFAFFKSKLDEKGFKTIKDTHHWSTLIGYKP